MNGSCKPCFGHTDALCCKQVITTDSFRSNTNHKSYNIFHHLNCKSKYAIYLGLVYTISDYFSYQITFLNPVKKTLQSMSVYTKPGKQPSDTVSFQNNFITSTIFVVFFAYLPSNRSTSFALNPSYYQSKVWEHFLWDSYVYM